MIALSKTIVGDYTYQPKNTYTLEKKEKILAYLKAKYMKIASDFEESEKIKFIDYDQSFFQEEPPEEILREAILKGKTVIEAAEDCNKRIQFSKT